MSAPGSQNWRRSHNRENSFQCKFISPNSDWTLTLLNCTRTQPTLPSFPRTISNLFYFPQTCFFALDPLLSADDLISWLAAFQSGNPPQAHGCSPPLPPTAEHPSAHCTHLPRWTTVCGCSLSFPFSSLTRLLHKEAPGLACFFIPT